MMSVGGIGGFLRLGNHTGYMLGRMRALIDAHSKALENLDTDDCDAKYAHDGSWTLPAGVGGGGSGLPEPLVEKNVLSSEPDVDDGFKWAEAPLVISADESGAETGFQFSKPNPAELPAHAQMKAVGGSRGDLLVRTATGAEWVTPEIEVEAVSGTLYVRLKLGASVYEGAVSGTSCATEE